MKQIYLIRHGETDYNRRGIIQGCGIDAPLNEKGRAQAKAFYEKYGHLNFDKVYTSRLLRAKQTVESFFQKGIPYEEHAGLNEINWGYYEGKKPSPGEKAVYHDLVAKWREGQCNLAAEGGESPETVARRQKVVLDLILSREDEKKVLICMHGRAMRIFLCQIFDKPLPEMDDFPHNNTGLYIINFNPASGPEIGKMNCTAHYEIITGEIDA